VDLLFEAIDGSSPGEVLVIDNDGRLDEACIGDLVVLEAKIAGLAAAVVWGLHRDELVLREIGLPVFSYGRLAVGPSTMRERPAEALASAGFGDLTVSASDMVVVDADGGVVVDLEHWTTVIDAAAKIVETEKRQSSAMRDGRSLRDQFDFASYLERRQTDPDYDFRAHLRSVGGAIEA
jgi:regulator of RNase E activity RraA